VWRWNFKWRQPCTRSSLCWISILLMESWWMAINTVKIYLCSKITPSEAIQKFFEDTFLCQTMPICHKWNISQKHVELDSSFNAARALLEICPVSRHQMHWAAALSQDLASARSWPGLHRVLSVIYCNWKDTCLGRYFLS